MVLSFASGDTPCVFLALIFGVAVILIALPLTPFAIRFNAFHSGSWDLRFIIVTASQPTHFTKIKVVCEPLPLTFTLAIFGARFAIFGYTVTVRNIFATLPAQLYGNTVLLTIPFGMTTVFIDLSAFGTPHRTVATV